jgi:pimeloyl-ACP methyl ester carboxylesterase
MSRRRRWWWIGSIGVVVSILVGVVFPESLMNLLRRVTISIATDRHGFVEIDGARVAWSEVGAGPAVILQHGLRGEATIMLPLARELAERGYRVLMIELPGHGLSSPSNSPLTIGSAAELIRRVALELDYPARPILIGHSMGGWVLAWDAWSHPQNATALCLISSPGYAFVPPPVEVLLPETVEQGRRAVGWMFAEDRYAPSVALWFAVRRDPTVALQMLSSALSGEFLLEGKLETVSLPTGILFGAKDRIIPPELGRSMARDLPHASYGELANAGHMVVWEEPRESAEWLDAFLRGHADLNAARH